MAGHLGRDKVQRLGLDLVAARRPPPGDELVTRLVVGFRRQGFVDAGRDDMRAPAQRDDSRRALLVAGGNVVIARREQPDAAARQVDLDAAAGLDPRQMNADPAVRQCDLGDAPFEPPDLDPGCGG